MRLVTWEDHFNCVCRIIDNSKKYVIILSPFWCVDNNPYNISIFDNAIGRKLKQDDDVHLLFLCNNNDEHEIVRSHYRKFYTKYEQRCSVFSLPKKFHIKLYMNETSFLITSRNVSGFSHKSLDLGVLGSDKKIMCDLKFWLQDLLNDSPDEYVRRFLDLYE